MNDGYCRCRLMYVLRNRSTKRRPRYFGTLPARPLSTPCSCVGARSLHPSWRKRTSNNVQVALCTSVQVAHSRRTDNYTHVPSVCICFRDKSYPTVAGFIPKCSEKSVLFCVINTTRKRKDIYTYTWWSSRVLILPIVSVQSLVQMENTPQRFLKLETASNPLLSVHCCTQTVISFFSWFVCLCTGSAPSGYPNGSR